MQSSDRTRLCFGLDAVTEVIHAQRRGRREDKLDLSGQESESASHYVCEVHHQSELEEKSATTISTR